MNINLTRQNSLGFELFALIKLFIAREVKLDVDPQRDDDASPMSTYR